MKDDFKFQVSREKQHFDFSNPDMDEVSQVFNNMFGDTFARAGNGYPGRLRSVSALRGYRAGHQNKEVSFRYV